MYSLYVVASANSVDLTATLFCWFEDKIKNNYKPNWTLRSPWLWTAATTTKPMDIITIQQANQPASQSYSVLCSHLFFHILDLCTFVGAQFSGKISRLLYHVVYYIHNTSSHWKKVQTNTAQLQTYKSKLLHYIQQR